jgi:hypothetical protein
MTDYKKSVLINTIDYLKKAVPDFVTEKSGKSKSIFTCPLCKNKLPSCSFKPFSEFQMYCTACKKSFDAIDVWKDINPSKNLSEEDILTDIQRSIGGNHLISPTEINNLIVKYQKLGFDLLPIGAGSKIPLEQGWQHKVHKELSEWENWIFKYNFNIGVKTGKSSNCIVIDFDSKIPKELKNILGDTLIQKTPRGVHYFYQYDSELSNTNNLGNLKIDIRSDGGQIVVAPSITDGESREFIDINKNIISIPQNVKEFLLSKYSASAIINDEDKIKADIDKENFNLGVLGNGDGRNNALVRIGGVLRKKLPVANVNTVLYTLNKTLFNPPLDYQEMRAMFNSLEKYSVTDETKFVQEVYERLKIPQEASLYDLLEMLELNRKSGTDREKLDTALKSLMKEGLIYKSHRMYHIVETPNWQTEFMDEGEEVKFKFPYFSDIAIVRDRDIVILGGATGAGKCISDGYLATNRGLVDISNFGSKRKEGVSSISSHFRIYSGVKNKCRQPNYFYKEKVNQTIKIKTFFGYEIEGTLEHPILIKDKYISKGTPHYHIICKKLSDIQEGDEVVIIPPNCFSDSEFSNKFKFVYKKNKHANNMNKIFIPNKMTPELGRFFGYVIGDGNLQKNTITIYQNIKYKKVHEDIMKLYSYFKLEPNIEQRENCIYYYFRSSILTSLVRKILFETNKINITSPNRKIPQAIFSASKDVQIAFLEAYINCESYLYVKKGNLELSSASLKLLQQIQIILLNLGIFVKLHSKFNKKYQRNYYRLVFSVIELYKLFQLCHLAKYYDYIPKKSQNPNIFLRQHSNQFKTSYYFDKIISKEYKNEEKYVYDFNIESKKYKKNNRFWCNGFINHNTHVSMNIIKRLKEQGIVPDYYSSEGGSRFATISKYLGLIEGDYRFCKEINPMKIKLTKDTVTIVDWLRPTEYSDTDVIFEKLNEEIQKQGGVLIVLMQLRKSSGDFFAKDLVEFYPALVSKFVQRENSYESYFETIKIREVRVRGASQNQIINCRFDFDTKELKTLNELETEGKL